ncbi:MAG: NYN domain-containing protein [Nocardioides sp.]
MLEEIASHGTATVRRAYADWTNDHTTQWKRLLNRHAIHPIQQFAYSTGKNATDFALVIDAMDLLYAGNLDGFVIVSSDSASPGWPPGCASRARSSSAWVSARRRRRS